MIGAGPRALKPHRALAWLLSVLLIAPLMGLAAVASPAIAAGDAQMQVVVTAVDPATGAPITSTAPGQYANRVGFRVDYSCLVANCDNATVKFDPTQLDPNLDYYRLLVQAGFSPPVVPEQERVRISGSATDGYTVTLGNLPAGHVGSFTVVYAQAGRPGDFLPRRDGERNGWAVANFPIGFEIEQTVTANADTATAPVTATSEPVVWENVIPAPGVTQSGPPARVETDTDYAYKVYMTSGCTYAQYNAVRGRVARASSNLCAEEYTVTHQLPPGVELVSAEGGPAVSGTVAGGLTLTWTRDRSDWRWNDNAEGGWISLDGSHNDSGSSPRTVTVRFPRENFAPPGRECNYDATSGAWKTVVDVGYIGLPGEAGVEKTASHTTGTVTISCVEPFAKAVADAKTSTFDGTARYSNGDSPINVPLPGDADNLEQWSVTVGNQANIDGVAVVTDDTLDLADAPVYRIETTPTGASVEWTATNGSTTISGTSTTPVDAPAGFRFATAVVTSPTLAGPNQYPNQAARTNFTVVFKYRVTSSAPAGERRTNQASAVMTYPGEPGLADVPLSIRSHTIQFARPFGKSAAAKGTDATTTTGRVDVGIPTTGSAEHRWFVDVYNRGNVSGVAVIDEPDLRAPGGLPVTKIEPYYHNGATWVRHAATVEYTLDNGVTGSIDVAAGQVFTAPAGRSFVAAKVTSAEIGSRNSDPVRNDQTVFRAYFGYNVPATATPDATWTNTATATMTYPDYPELDDLDSAVTSSARLVAPPVPPVTFNATVGRNALPGGATAAGPTTDVTFTVGGSTSGVGAARDITPQYVFAAPTGWSITEGSASFPAGSVPAGVQFSYRTATIGGVARQIVVATWPAGTVFGENRSLPVMSVVARPGSDIPAGTVSRPDAYIGNSGDPVATDVFTTPFTDAPDLDGDGDRTERFATANNSGAATTVAAVAGMQVVKEICFPDPSAEDGCVWYSDSENVVGVPPNSTNITYRISITNTGNMTLADVVAYDVLPYVGDTGTSAATADTPRGSTFRETVETVGTPTNLAEVSFSGAEQPCRPEVDPTVADCVDDWGDQADGAQAIRLARPGNLPPGAGFSLEYNAAVVDAPGFGAVACNSVAVRAAGLGAVAEPSPVCASIEEADVRIVAGTPALQQDRPGVLPFTVTNLGGAPSTQASVDVAIPEGLEVTSFTPTGWTCTATDADGDPVFGTAVGPATLTCAPDSALAEDVPVALDIPVIARVASITVGAEITGRLFDGDLANNEAELTIAAADFSGAVEVAKDDGRTVASPGDELTYTLTVHNPLRYETLSGARLTDAVPTGTSFVSASGGGIHSSGTVTWNLPDLAGDGSTTVTVTVRVLPTAAAEIINVANVSAPDPANRNVAITGSARDEDALSAHPGVSLVKGSVESEYDADGQTITYTFDIENTGDVTLSQVALADPLSGLSAITISWPGTAGTLAPGQHATARATYAVTQADLDAGHLTNTATVTSRAPDLQRTDDSASHTLLAATDPHLTVDKQAAGAVVNAGDTVSYTFTVVNDGNQTLHDVVITDPMAGLSAIEIDWPGAAGALAPGQTATATAAYTATQADVDAGELVNTATARGRTALGAEATDDDTVTIPIEPAPSLTLDKEGSYAPGTRGAAGDELQYEFVVENTGNVTLTDVEIADPLPGLSVIDHTWPGEPGVLLPGQVATATASYRVTQSDVDGLTGVENTATATASPPDGEPVAARDTVTMNTPALSGIQIVKTATVDGPTPVRPGALVEYSFAITNLGDLTLDGAAIADELPGLSSITIDWPGDDGVLAPRETAEASATYAITQADIDAGRVVNTARATATDVAGDAVSDEDGAVVVLAHAPALRLAKDASYAEGARGAAGEVVRYDFVIENTGNVSLAAIVLSDPMPGLSQPVITWPGEPGLLAPGQVATATAEYTLTQADVDAGSVSNTASVRSVDPDGEPADDDDTATIPTSIDAALQLEKTVELPEHAPLRAGDVIEYRFEATNLGDRTLAGVDIVDRAEGVSALEYEWPGPDGVLRPGQSVSATAVYRLTQDDVDAGQVVNTATARGEDPTGEPLADDDTAMAVIDPAPAVSIDKSARYADGTTGRVGEEIIYDFVIENTGNVALADVVLTDRLPGLSTPAMAWPGPEGVLRPGQVATATATYTLTQADVDRPDGVVNTASASGTDRAGTTVTSDDVAVVATSADSGIQLAKTASPGSQTPQAGDTVEYRFAVTNLGERTLSGVSIDDPMPGLSALDYEWPGPVGVLAAHEVATATASYTLTQADIDAGRVDNTATASGSEPGGRALADDAGATVVLPAAPAISLEKTGARSGSSLGAAVGDVVTYTFIVENTGNVTVEDVLIDDPMPGLSELDVGWPGEAGVLAPGAQATATATYVLTRADLDAGTLTNVATASTDLGATAESTFVLDTRPSPLPPGAAQVVGALASTGVQAGTAIAAASVLFGAALVLLLARRRSQKGAPGSSR